MKVLLVEDSTPLRGIIRQMLTNLGYDDIAEAADGEEAWQQLSAEPFDLLLTDWNMPNMSGLELLQKVRQTQRFDSLPVVMLTTRSNAQDIISAMKAGINNYVVKPCKPSDLKEKIDKAILQQAKKKPAAAASAERIIRGCRKFHPAQNGPYVLFYETPTDVEALTKGEDPELQRYYDCVYDVLGKANAAYPGLDLGYALEQETQDVTKLASASEELVRLVLVSARHATGLSLVRRLRYGQETAPPTYVVCDSFMGLDADVRSSIADMGVEILERREIDADHFHELVVKHLIPPVENGPEGLKYLEVYKGAGPQPQEGQRVSVQLTGMLRDSSVFDDSRRRGEPQQFVVGSGDVVRGLELGVCTMGLGGKTLFVVPPDLGFPNGHEDLGIQADEELVYMMELLEVADVTKTTDEDPLVQ